MRKNIYTFLAICVLLTGLLSNTYAVAENMQVNGPTDSTDIVESVDSVNSYIWEGYVEFPLNVSVLDTAYMDNHALLETIDSLANSMETDADSIIITGTASPEGREKFNLELAGNRVQTFKNYLVDNYNFHDSDFVRTQVRVFQWKEIIPELKSDSLLPDSAAVIKVLETPNTTEFSKGWTLRTKHKDAYHYINDKYLTFLRKGQVSVYYHHVVPVPVIFLPVDTVPEEPQIEEPQPIEQKEKKLHREVMSVKTNLLLDGAWIPGYDDWCPIPNVAVEFYPRKGHFTYGASVDFPWWSHYDEHKYFQLLNIQLESRFYFHASRSEGAAFRGMFANAYVHAGLASICFDANHGWMGEGLGGGLGIGYVLPLGKKQHIRMEFAAQFGAVWCGYDPYQYESPVQPAEHDNLYYYKWTQDASLFQPRMYRWMWLGPTRVGITLSADLIYRKKSKTE